MTTESLMQGPNTEDIFRKGAVILGGGLFLGRSEVLLRHVADFRRALSALLDRGWVGSEQQVFEEWLSTEIVWSNRLRTENPATQELSKLPPYLRFHILLGFSLEEGKMVN